MFQGKAKTVSEYLAALPPERRARREQAAVAS